MKTFKDLAKKLNNGTDHNSRIVNMVSTLAQPKTCRGIVTHSNNNLAWAMIVGEGHQAFIPTNLTEMNDLRAGDVIEMTIIENDFRHRHKTPYRAITLTRVDAEVQPAPAPDPQPVEAPKPRLPRFEGIRAGSEAEAMAFKLINAMRPGEIYRTAQFASVIGEDNGRQITKVFEALHRCGHVNRIHVTSSEDRRAGRVYWSLPGAAFKCLDAVCYNGKITND
jgi:hypothetical protein